MRSGQERYGVLLPGTLHQATYIESWLIKNYPLMRVIFDNEDCRHLCAEAWLRNAVRCHARISLPDSVSCSF